MKFTLSWLKDHLGTSASVAEIADKLTAIGLEIESVTDPAKALAPFKIAYVVEAVQHPNADKLRVCKVDAGEGIVQVVCGAPNARTGMKGVFAPAGTYVPGSDLLLKATKIRGVDSNGMLCSARELMLGDDHDGIIELAPDAPVGHPALEVLPIDPVFDVAITPNRPDCLGVYGIARDLSAAGIGQLKHGDASQGVTAVKGTFPCPVAVKLEFVSGTESACPVFAGRLVRGVKNGPSPKWLQDRLKAIGLRPISTLVDITNFISIDRGRPLHVYDAAKLKGAVSARLGRGGEKLTALDGKTYDIDAEMCVIADESGAIGLGGVMGGESTGVSEGTTDVFIESAYFDPLRTAMTGRRLSILSDARYRFERGVDPAFVELGLELATRMVIDLGGGTPSEKLVAGKPPIEDKRIDFDTGEIARLIGVEQPEGETVRILTALGFAPHRHSGGHLALSVPPWRPDIGGQADIVEEAARIWGLDKVPSTPMRRPDVAAPAVLTRAQRRQRVARRALGGRGLTEAVTWSFIPRGTAVLFGGGNAALVLDNPISSEMTTMRPSLLPGLLAAAARNAARAISPVEMFEIGRTFSADQDGEANCAAIVRQGSRPKSWQGGALTFNAYDAKTDALAVLAELGAPSELMQSEDAPAWYHPGRSGALKLGPKVVLAHFGEVHPAALKALDLKGPAVAVEVYLDAIPEPRSKGRAKGKLDAPDLMPVTRDFAFVVDAKVRGIDLLKAARGADKALIADVSLFDVYEGKGVEVGKKSVAIEVRLQPREKTLTDADIDAVSQRIIAAVVKATGGTLRT